MKLSEFIENYIEVLPTGIVLGEEQITRTLLKAVRFYCGFTTLDNGEIDADGIHTLLSNTNEIEGCLDIDLNYSEWAIVRPLFDLYIELENATSLEASRGQGLDVYGRGTSEIQGDIREMETNMNIAAFSEPVFSV